MKRLIKILALCIILILSACSLFACGETTTSEGKTGLLYKKFGNDDFYTVYGYVDEGKGVTELDIGAADFLRISCHLLDPFLDPDRARTVSQNCVRGMGNDEDCGAAVDHFLYLLPALFLEEHIAHAQHLIQDQDARRISRRSHGEAEPGDHAG